MKTKPNDPINVFQNNYQNPQGLTKREEFARSAMQGILSNSVSGEFDEEEKKLTVGEIVSTRACAFADALIVALNEEKK